MEVGEEVLESARVDMVKLIDDPSLAYPIEVLLCLVTTLLDLLLADFAKGLALDKALIGVVSDLVDVVYLRNHPIF